MRKPVMRPPLELPNNAEGVREALQTSLIPCTDPLATFMIKNDILSVTLGGSIQTPL